MKVALGREKYEESEKRTGVGRWRWLDPFYLLSFSEDFAIDKLDMLAVVIIALRPTGTEALRFSINVEDARVFKRSEDEEEKSEGLTL